ncbi:MAG: DUF692 domain-containing protein [Zoogloeaceae bacterium]|nr:DUF692 domain-containing protein [Zoogloeaceae bacterium]
MDTPLRRAATITRRRAAIPSRAGIGLRTPHIREILATRPNIGWVEVHSENFFCDGGQPLAYLDRIRQDYAVSLHGVGLSLGSLGPLDTEHLTCLKRLVERVEPGLISEHLSWSAVGGRHLNELLPLPYTEEALAVVCRNVHQTQEALGQPILVENISSYLRFTHSPIPEPEFIAEVTARTGCGLLLDVNNVFVSATNHGFDARAYLAAIPAAAVEEVHLAGHDRAGDLLIDTHGARVASPVWRLYQETVARLGPVPTLIEWDNDLPPLAVLVDEMRHADHLLEACHAVAA